MNEEDLKRGLASFRARMKDAIPLDHIELKILQELIQATQNVLRAQSNNSGRAMEAEIYETVLKRLGESA